MSNDAAGGQKNNRHWSRELNVSLSFLPALFLSWRAGADPRSGRQQLYLLWSGSDRLGSAQPRTGPADPERSMRRARRTSDTRWAHHDWEYVFWKTDRDLESLLETNKNKRESTVSLWLQKHVTLGRKNLIHKLLSQEVLFSFIMTEWPDCINKGSLYIYIFSYAFLMLYFVAKACKGRVITPVHVYLKSLFVKTDHLIE